MCDYKKGVVLVEARESNCTRKQGAYLYTRQTKELDGVGFLIDHALDVAYTWNLNRIGGTQGVMVSDTTCLGRGPVPCSLVLWSFMLRELYIW